MFKIGKYTFGSDFEVFTKNSSDEIVPAIIDGTKEKPEPIGKGCYSQRDGVAAEFNIPPVSTKRDWLKNIKFCMREGSKIVAKQGLTLEIGSSHEFDTDILDEKDYRTLGCQPSLDAYDFNSPRVFTNSMTDLRTCGMHVHVGFNKHCPNTGNTPGPEDIANLTYYFDLYLGLPSVILDNDQLRRTMYGKAGDFRFKILDDICLYEYRSLGSNLLSNDDYIKWIYSNMKEAIKAYNKQLDLPDLKLMKKIIESGDVAASRELILKHSIGMPNVI